MTTRTLCLPDDPSSVRQARGFVRAQLVDWDLADLVDDASLVVTELATNAVVHAHSDYTVTATRLGDAVRLAVHDGGGGTVAPAAWTSHRVGGRGLLLVESLATGWGVETDDADRTGTTGKTVWAELAG